MSSKADRKRQMEGLLGMLEMVETLEGQEEPDEEYLHSPDFQDALTFTMGLVQQDSQDRPKSIPLTKQDARNKDVLECLEHSRDHLQDFKPGDRSGLDRSYQIALTDLEKVIANFAYYVVGDG